MLIPTPLLGAATARLGAMIMAMRPRVTSDFIFASGNATQAED
jgi:hypothetical protein